MATLRGFRRWWRVPRSASDPTEREVSFLELFFDLVFVVIVARLSHHLAQHPDLHGIAWYLFTFVPVWIAWNNGAIYHDMHGPNDLSTRVFTFAQMLTVGAMAVFIEQAGGRHANAFALSYACNQLILAWMWFRTGIFDRDHRSMSTPYALITLAAVATFVGSIFVAPPIKFWMWGAAISVQFLVPFINMTFTRRFRDLAELVVTPSIVERFGLFVIIVMGEVVVGTINGVANHGSIDLHVGSVAILGGLLAIALWFLYFDTIARRLPQTRLLVVSVGIHFVVIAALAALGAGILHAIQHTGEPLSIEAHSLLVGSTCVATLGIGALMLTVREDNMHPIRKQVTPIVVGAAVLMALLGAFPLPVKPTLALLVALLLAPVISGLVQWAKTPLEVPD